MWLRWRRGRREGVVEAEIRYLRDARVRPHVDTYDHSKTFVPTAKHRVRFHDLRADGAPSPSLDAEGFTLIAHRSEAADFGDARQHDAYSEELRQLLCELTGSPLVFVSPLMVLRSRSHPHYSGDVIADRVAEMVHCDRTDRSVRMEAAVALRHRGIDTMPEGRLVAYNLWRVLSPPPQDFPLALCDLRTVRAEHLVRADSTGDPTSSGEELEFYLPLFDRGHRWCYFSNLTRDELLMFRQYDSAASGPSGVPHTAFRDPSCASSAATRVSVEARAYVFFPS